MEGGLRDTNFGRGMCAVGGAAMASLPVSDWLVTPVPRISWSRCFLRAGIEDQEIGSGELGSKGATGGGMDVPLLFAEVIQDGEFLPTLPLVTMAEPGKIPGPPGEVCRMVIPPGGLPLVGGPAKPLAQHGP